VRLLLAMSDATRAEKLATLLYSRWEDWWIELCTTGPQAVELLDRGAYDLLLLGTGRAGDRQVLSWLEAGGLCSPPRVLRLDDTEGISSACADRTVPVTATPEQLCALLEALAKKPLPHLALQMQRRLEPVVEAFLDELNMPAALKGRRYAAWLLLRLTTSRASEREAAGEWYRLCAGAHGTTPGAVERCLRVAVESVFTQGSLRAIERCFGATVDPEKGKPTNRVFLIKAAEHLRSLLDGHPLAEQQRDAPQPCSAHQRVNDTADGGGLPAEEIGDQVELEHAHQRPVDGTDNDQCQRDLIKHGFSLLF